MARAVDLLIGNVPCTHKRGIAYHWCMSPEDSLPAGCFGRVMARNRLVEILNKMHVANNNDREVLRRKAWKELW